MVSIKDIAKLVGMSYSTVSRVVNGQKYVKAHIRDKILAVIKETGYVPNQAARSMVMQRTFTVGIVIPDTFNMFQRELFATIEHHLEASGYRTQFFFVKAEDKSELACLRRIKSEKLDGIIVIHEMTHGDFYDYLEQTEIPAVLCTFERAGSSLCAVHANEEKAACEAVNHLIGLGHRNIGIVTGMYFSFAKQRLAGYRRAFEENGLKVDENRIVYMPSYTSESGREGIRQLLSRNLGLSAVFAITDDLAVGVMRGLFEAGLSVPKDMSVAGFDDIDISGYLSPGLTTIRQPIAELGRTTAATIERLINGEAVEDRRIVFTPALVQRESSAPPAR